MSADGVGGAVSAQDSSNINFTNSIVTFTGNTAPYGSAIYAGNSSKISFINTDVFFVGNSGSAALYVKESTVNISGNMEFIGNSDGDIGLENSKLIFLPKKGKVIKFKGKINSEGMGNTMLKAGGGEIVFDDATPIHLSNIDFLIAEGTARFDSSSNTFKELEISSVGILGISIDFAALMVGGRQLYLKNFIIDTGASLSVITLNGGLAEMGSSAAFVYAATPIDAASFEYMNVVGVGGYNYSLSLDETKHIGFLTIRGFPPILPPSFNISPVFVANAIRQSAISDNSPIYSNIGKKAWLSAQAGGGSLADDDLVKFDSAAAGAKAGFAFFSGRDFSAGAFAGFASRSYKQGSNKATASDMDFGLYGSYALGKKANLAGFAGYGLQNVSLEGGGSNSEFDATVIKFGAKAEYSAGLISPFVGLEGAMLDVGDVDLGGGKLEAASYTRLSSQLGAKIGRQSGKLTWYGKAYVNLLLAGAKPQYNLKHDVEGAKSVGVDGTAENAASFGLGAGVSLPMSGAVDVFASADTRLNADYFGYRANVGVSFRFNNRRTVGKRARGLADAKPKPEVIPQVLETPKQEVKQAPLIEPEVEKAPKTVIKKAAPKRSAVRRQSRRVRK